MFRKMTAGLVVTGMLATVPAGVALARPSDDPVAATAGVTYDLSADEAAALTYLREEEKLAHDVYVALYEIWGASIFERISASETRHMDAVLTLLDRYGLADPAAGNAAGVFTDPSLQAVYDDLVERGSASLEDAYEVGALIEEMDIDDLERDIAMVDNPDIVRVMENLLKGSSNHLRAFVSSLNAAGGDFVPEYLDQAQVAEILSADRATGRSARASRPGRNR